MKRGDWIATEGKERNGKGGGQGKRRNDEIMKSKEKDVKEILD